MTPSTSTYGLTLTRGQAEYLLLLVSIGELAIAEPNRSGWLPGGSGDAALMTQYLQKIRGAPSLETPTRELGAWLKRATRCESGSRRIADTEGVGSGEASVAALTASDSSFWLSAAKQRAATARPGGVP